jgi:large subunit ribosomal protein L24
MHIKTNDIVLIISGPDRGQRGKVLKVITDKRKVVIEGANRVYKHMRRSQKNPQGGRLSKEMPIDISNVALLDPKSDKPTRVGVRVLPDGTKERYAKRSGASLGAIAKPRKTAAKK